MPKKRVNWAQVKEKVKEALAFFESQGVRPTLRTLFYWLVSKEILPNTRNYYTQLSSYFVQWRKNGDFAWDAIADQARRTLGYHTDNINVDIDYYKEQLDEKLEELSIDALLEEYLPSTPYFYVEKWYKQPVVPEIWIEKEALAETLYNWTRGLGIKIRVNKGYSSWTFLWENIKEIKSVLERHERVVILYCGDYDPSGTDMDRFLQEALEFFGIDPTRIIFRRLAVTDEQIKQFNLPPKPEDAETIEKLARDPRSKKFFGREDFFTLPIERRMEIIRKSKKFVVELDALVAYVPDKFRSLIRDTVKSYWNEEIYQEYKSQVEKATKKAEELRKEALEKAKEKLKQILGE